MRTPLTTLAGLALTCSLTGVAVAAVFPDVPDDSLFQEPIEHLFSAGVVKGNPDGTYDPKGLVNRAEMLTLLYRAKGKTPDPASVRCFPDVIPGSWYEGVVCDAAAHGYVKGYATGRFEAANPVNRVEALKMVHEVLGLEVSDITEEMKDVVKFVDVSTSAWYTGYLANAYIIGMLPIPGQDGSRFYPDRPLTREEAAAMIYNAINADIRLGRTESSSSSAMSDSSSSASSSSAAEYFETAEECMDATGMQCMFSMCDYVPEGKTYEEVCGDHPGSAWSPVEGTSASSSSAPSASSSSSPSVDDGILEVEFPYAGGGKFDGKKPFSYRFGLDERATVRTRVELNSGQPGKVTCTLYLLADSGFSERYYIGIQEGGTCTILATMSPGNYQLQLQPTNADVTYEVSTAVSSGDGNDGFVEANVISTSSKKTYVMEAGNYEDWYTFFVSGGNDDGKRMLLELSNATSLRCIIYSMNDVDLFGFESPQCNQFYNYPPGTYYVSVARDAPQGTRQTYTIRLKE